MAEVCSSMVWICRSSTCRRVFPAIPPFLHLTPALPGLRWGAALLVTVPAAAFMPSPAIVRLGDTTRNLYYLVPFILPSYLLAFPHYFHCTTLYLSPFSSILCTFLHPSAFLIICLFCWTSGVAFGTLPG